MPKKKPLVVPRNCRRKQTQTATFRLLSLLWTTVWLRANFHSQLDHWPKLTAKGEFMTMLARFGSCLLAALILSLGGSHASAELDLQFLLDDATPIVGPHDQIVVTGTVINAATSDETLFGFNFEGGLAMPDTLFTNRVIDNGGPYRFEFGGPGGVPSLVTQARSVDLAPGESTRIVFATLTPDPAPVPLGVYSSSRFQLTYHKSPGTLAVRTFQLTSPFTVTVVPEPASFALISMALLMAGLIPRSATRSLKLPC